MEFKINQDSLNKIIQLLQDAPTKIGLPIINIIQNEAKLLSEKEEPTLNQGEGNANTDTKGTGK